MDSINEPNNTNQMLENNIDGRNLLRHINSTGGNIDYDGNCITSVVIHGDAINNTHLHRQAIDVDARKRKASNGDRERRTQNKEEKRPCSSIHQQNENVNIYI